MYVQHSVHVGRSADECATDLAAGPRTWFPHLDADHASQVGVRVAGISVRKRVVVELGQPTSEGDWTSFPLTWKATFPEQLFPVLVGKIELAPSGKSQTRLTVSGMYEPPLGRIGALLDDALMHNVADGTVKELTESIARQLRSAARVPSE
jgi:hypothetical protein